MFKIISILAVLSLITNIAYANVSTAFEYKSRTFYSELENDPFQFSSRFKTNIHFPNIKRSFNIDPQLESIHYFNHSDASTKSISRLSQAYVNFSVPNYKISIGEKNG